MFRAPPGTSLLNLRHDAPRRPPDWRWLRAQALRAAGRCPSRLTDDADIVLAMDFQQALEACGPDEWSRLELYEPYPDLFEAADTHHDATDAGKAKRWELEARLLCANASLEESAARLAMRPGAVVAYERLFYNVRDRLGARGWVAQQAIGLAAHTGPAEQDVGIVWKALAYAGGVKVLEDLLCLFGGELVTDEAGLERYYREQGKALVVRRALVAALTLRLRDPLAKLQLLELSQKYQQAEQAAGAVGGEERMLDGLRLALEQVRFYVGPAGDPNGIAPVLPNGAELRADQVLRAGAGLPVEVPADLQAAQFPQPRRLADAELDEEEPPEPEECR